MRKVPHFRSLGKALNFIQNRLPLLEERRMWQSMQQSEIDAGSSWDSD